MATVKSWSDLEKALRQARDKALEGTGEKAKELVKDRIDEDVYDKYNPVDGGYQRSYDLRESVQPSNLSSSGNVAEIEIGHDTTMIRSVGNQHKSVVDGSSSVDSIAEIVHNGLTGAIRQGGYWRDAPWYDAEEHTFAESRPYMDNAKQEMKDGKYKEFMEKELNSMGIKTK